MGRAFGSVWRGILDFYDDLFPFVGMNLIWVIPAGLIALVLSTLYLIAYGQPATGAPDDPTSLFAFLVALAFVVIAPNPVAAGIHYYANQKANEEHVEFSLFWMGLRTYWKKATLLSLISIAVLGLLIANLAFYQSRESEILRAVSLVFVWVLLLWVMMQMYVLPLLIEQESKSIRLVLRNAAVLTLANPGFSIVLLILLLIITIASIGITVLIALIGASLVAIIEQRAVLTLLERHRPKSQG